jgi:hypothetical protein
MTNSITVQVEPNAYALGQNMVNFIAAVKQALADGWQPGTDLPVILTAILTDIVPIISNLNQLGPEKADNMKAFITSFALSLEDLAFLFI